MPNLEHLTLPPLSQRLRTILKELAADESRLTASFRGTPTLVAKTSNLVEKTLIRVMEEIEKGPGSTRIW